MVHGLVELLVLHFRSDLPGEGLAVFIQSIHGDDPAKPVDPELQGSLAGIHRDVGAGGSAHVSQRSAGDADDQHGNDSQPGDAVKALYAADFLAFIHFDRIAHPAFLPRGDDDAVFPKDRRLSVFNFQYDRFHVFSAFRMYPRYSARTGYSPDRISAAAMM